ncbi:helicase SNF2 [Sorangium cellulosum]|uniref:Helicase SNF2 n=1 Tax=Sorangium cellulosum TaxID=56 RepID=A0A4P2Q1V0_SORCE|nr:DEAD/DEAH box helicase [Sorangium cellulosum]AUX23255.1 helicase SNF2 [Sorangium cellulosum]
MAHAPEAAAPVARTAPFATHAALLAWLSQHGITHVARLNLEALAPGVDPALWPELRALGARRRLTELASAEALAGARAWLSPSRLRDALPSLVVRFLEDARAEADEARAALPALLEPPEEPRARAVHARLRELRARVPDAVAPRPARALAAGALRFDAALPGFRLDDPRPFESALPASPGFVVPEARLCLAPGALRAECTCGASACVHALAAIDAALRWLRQPPGDAFFEALAELDRPAWERTLLLLDRALDEGPAARAGVEITFRLDVLDDARVEVAPWLHRLNRKGQRGGAGTRLTRRRLLQEHGAKLSADDARVAALLPDGDGLASRALLEALIGHPRLVLGEAPDVAVRIERAPVGLVAEERGGAVRVSAGVDGTALPAALLDRVRRARPEEALFLWDWDRDARRLTLLDVKPELRALLGVLQREGHVFPPESRGALLGALARWAQRLPVAMPRSVMGESVPAALAPVLRLTPQPAGAVEVELRVRPLPESPALVPGEGARDVLARRGERALHAVRDLDREADAFRALAAELPLAGAEALPQRFQFRFASAEGALDLVAACARRAPPPELEWVGTPLRVVGAGGPGALKVVLERRRAWFGVLGGLSVEGERVTLARLLDSARRKERYVEVTAHTYVELSEALRRHLERLSDHVHASQHGLSVGLSAAEALRALEADGAALEADAAFRRLVERVAAARELSPAVPEALRAELRPYQVDGFRWLSRLAAWGAGGVLADDMGLGKTVQALALLLDRRALGPALVVAPTSVAFNWVAEAERFAPSLRLTLYAEAADRDDALEWLGPGDVLVLSYGLLVRDAARLSARRFATVVFDEAQALKNATTQRVRAARALQADFRCALSGTPIENHLGELWSLFAVVFPGLLGGWESFRSRYAAPIERQADPAAAPALARVLAPFLLRRTKAEVEAELPARTEVRVPVVLSSAEWQLYEDARLAALSDLESRRSALRQQERRVEVLAALTRLRLLASHPRLHDPRSELGSSKLARFLELVEELCAEGQRALVFSQFTSHLALAREALEARGVAYVYLDGRTPRAARAERVCAFQEGTAPLFLISLKAGGFGLNLTAATNVIHLDPWWNPAVEDQASDRAHRLGQTRPVTIYRLVALGTIEEKMLALHAEKRSLVAEVLRGKDEAARLSTEDLVGLLSRPPGPEARGG